MKNNYNRVIGIQCYGTSGTTLMHSLLDNHPSIISLPFLHGRDLYTLWTDHIVGSGNNIEGATELHEYDEPMTIDVSIDTIIEKVKKFRAGGGVEASDMSRGCGAVVKGKSFKGTF